MTVLTQTYIRFRWMQFPAMVLMFVMQRTPVLRAIITTEFTLHATAGTVLKGMIASAAAMGTVHTLAGATELNAGSGGNPVQGAVGESFAGGFSVTGAPAVAASYRITGTVPAGLTITGINAQTVNDSVVTITGTPTQSGTFPLSVTAWKGANRTGQGGSPTFTYTIEVAAAQGTAPAISAQPQTQTTDEGQSVTFSVTASGDPAPTFQWRKDGAEVTGATSSTFSISSVATNDAGGYTVVISNASGNVTSASATLTVTTAAVAPAIIGQPSNQDASVGSNVAFSVTIDGSPSGYQWFRHRAGDSAGAQAMAGATSATLNLSGVQAADMGFYFARVSIGGSTVDSATAILTLAGGESRLVNLSTRGRIAAGGTLTPGFVLRGDGPKPLVVRSVGPKLFDFSVSDALADPTMDLIPQGSSTPLLTNDNWGDAANAEELITASASLGAFGLNPGSLDAAILADVPLPNSQGNRGYTVRISSTSTTASGIALAEVYDPQNAGVGADLVNVSALGNSGPGVDALVPGFVIGGTGAKTMLIRVVGPELSKSKFGVVGVMADPKLAIVPLGQSYTIAENDDWNGADTLKTAFANSGAFGFDDDTSKDAAVLVRLPPGGYTVKVESAGGESGIVLVEAYDLD